MVDQSGKETHQVWRHELNIPVPLMLYGSQAKPFPLRDLPQNVNACMSNTLITITCTLLCCSWLSLTPCDTKINNCSDTQECLFYLKKNWCFLKVVFHIAQLKEKQSYSILWNDRQKKQHTDCTQHTKIIYTDVGIHACVLRLNMLTDITRCLCAH